MSSAGLLYVSRRNVNHHYRIFVTSGWGSSKGRIIRNMQWRPSKDLTVKSVADLFRQRPEPPVKVQPESLWYKCEIFVKAIVIKGKKTSPEWVYEIRMMTYSKEPLSQAETNMIWVSARRNIRDIAKLDDNMRWRTATDYQVGVETGFIEPSEVRAVSEFPKVTWVLHFWNAGQGRGKEGVFIVPGHA
jgi:hypothetical protein